MIYKSYTLQNGIRLVHKHWPSVVANCGVIINTGSRDEKPSERGMAHFIEHTLFKGTRRRKAYHILSRIENMGGLMNAFTTKEETCIYGSFLKYDYSRVMELFSDISQNATFPEKEITKEKDIVLDEINSYRDSPAEAIFDEFEDLLFSGHPLGSNILGTPQHVRSFTKKQIFRFIKENYHTHQTVICSVGDIPFPRLIKLAEKYFGTIKSTGQPKKRIPFNGNPAFHQSKKKANYQTHSIIGSKAYSWQNSGRYPLTLLNHILGGPGMSTRLNMNISEKYGFCYNLESHYQPYSDTGVFMVYMGTDSGYLKKTTGLVLKEIRKLREQKLGSLQLQRAKKQLTGQLALSNESALNQMIGMGKSILIYNRVEPIQEIIDKINAIDSSTILEAANEILSEDKLNQLTYST
ncbi:MAG: pitrilysin family protein [Bacteroidales bacterium]